MKLPVQDVRTPEDAQLNFEFLGGSIVYWGDGAPAFVPDGNSASYYFRRDAGVSTHIYYFNGSSWAAIV